MASYRIIAQHFFSSQRIAKIVQAVSEDAALRSVAHELSDANYYAVQAIRI